MAEQRMLTTGQVARHCQVTHKTVNNWIRRGKLKSFTTPGRHHRIRVHDLCEFLEDTGLPPLPETLAPPGRARVLVVDDNEDIVETISIFVRRWGYEVSTALNGFSAGLEVERFKPDLVVLDLMMPYVDGFDVCRTIKSDPTTRHIQVLVLTGYTEQGFIDQARDCGADQWMAKPFQPQALQRRIGELLGKHGKG